jgi:hypothetical protein
MRKIATAALLVLSVGLSGCVISVGADGEYDHHADWQDIEHKNRKHIAALQPNQSYQAIAERMGLADFNELYEDNGDTVQVLYYRTQRIEGDGVTTKDECTPLVFKNQKLVGWGDSAYSLIRG